MATWNVSKLKEKVVVMEVEFSSTTYTLPLRWTLLVIVHRRKYKFVLWTTSESIDFLHCAYLVGSRMLRTSSELAHNLNRKIVDLHIFRSNPPTMFFGTLVKIGTIQRRLAWPLRKDDTLCSRNGSKVFFCFSLIYSPFHRCLHACRLGTCLDTRLAGSGLGLSWMA